MSEPKKAQVKIQKLEGAVYPLWTCELEAYNKKIEELNVADPFTLNCVGDFVENLGSDLKIKVTEPGHPYSLKILKVIKSENEQLQIKSTSYIPGEHKIKFQILNPDNKGVEVNELNINVTSVIDPEKGMPTSYGVIGPMQMTWPTWFVFVFIGLIAVLVVSGLLASFKSYQKKKVLKSIMLVDDQDLKALKKHERYKLSLKIFIKKIREYRREFLKPEALRTKEYSVESYTKDLRDEFILYVSRLFMVPLTEKKQKNILTYLKKRHPFFYDNFQKDFNYILNELEGVTTENFDKESLQRLFDNLQHSSEKISAHLRRLS